MAYLSIANQLIFYPKMKMENEAIMKFPRPHSSQWSLSFFNEYINVLTICTWYNLAIALLVSLVAISSISTLEKNGK